jgi:hypothetical protein
MPQMTPHEVQIQILSLRVRNLTATVVNLVKILGTAGATLPLTGAQKLALAALITDSVPPQIDNT